jgi:hypothetical protein
VVALPTKKSSAVAVMPGQVTRGAGVKHVAAVAVAAFSGRARAAAVR